MTNEKTNDGITHNFNNPQLKFNTYGVIYTYSRYHGGDPFEYKIPIYFEDIKLLSIYPSTTHTKFNPLPWRIAVKDFDNTLDDNFEISYDKLEDAIFDFNQLMTEWLHWVNREKIKLESASNVDDKQTMKGK